MLFSRSRVPVTLRVTDRVANSGFIYTWFTQDASHDAKKRLLLLHMRDIAYNEDGKVAHRPLCLPEAARPKMLLLNDVM